MQAAVPFHVSTDVHYTSTCVRPVTCHLVTDASNTVRAVPGAFLAVRTTSAIPAMGMTFSTGGGQLGSGQCTVLVGSSFQISPQQTPPLLMAASPCPEPDRWAAGCIAEPQTAVLTLSGGSNQGGLAVTYDGAFTVAVDAGPPIPQ